MKAPRLCVVLLTLVCGHQGDGLLAQPGSVGSLVIDETQVVNRHVVVTVRNVGATTITAWGVRGLATFDGGSTQLIDLVADGYESGFRIYPKGKVVVFVPGATVTTRIGAQLHDAAVTGISLEPRMLVFDDGTAAGDEQEIELVFAGRRRERRAWRLIDDVLARQIETKLDPFTALAVIERELEDTSDAEVRRTGAYTNFRRNLSIAMELASARRLDLGKRLREMQQDTRSRRAAADRNYQRR